MKASQICVCRKMMQKHSSYVGTQECYAGGGYGTKQDKQDGWLCSCGLFLGRTGCVYNGKTYPYWKYGSDDIKKILGIKP